MSDSNWSVRFAVVAAFAAFTFVTLGTGAYFGSLYAPERKDYQTVGSGEAGRQDYSGPSESLPDIAALPGPVERSIANPRPQTGEDHEQRDLAAQEASALWAFWIAVISALSVAVTTVGTIFLYQQIKLTREAVRDTGDATEAMVEANRIAEAARIQARRRPYVVQVATETSRIDVVDQYGNPRPDHNIAQIGVVFRNVGDVPTPRCRFFITNLLVFPPGPIPPFEITDEDGDEESHTHIAIGREVEQKSPVIDIPNEIIQKALRGECQLVIGAGVLYKDIFTDEEFRTRSVLLLEVVADPFVHDPGQSIRARPLGKQILT